MRFVRKAEGAGAACSGKLRQYGAYSEELEYADQIMRKIRCPVFDVSHKAVEEVANKILQLVREEARNGE